MILIFRRPEKLSFEALSELERLSSELEEIEGVEERKAFVSQHTAAWRNIKSDLLEMSHGKCWYSEAKEFVSDWHVDHFRPKSGYDWLAFDWENYRVCGCIPNRTKRDDFPLADGSPRASKRDRCVDDEVCELLDPTKPDDPLLITFDETGLPKPAAPLDEVCKRRVTLTVKLLGLDSERLREGRRKVWRDCDSKTLRVRLAFDENQHLQNPFSNMEVRALAEELRQMTSPEAPFSGTATACLRANAAEWMVQHIPRPEAAA